VTIFAPLRSELGRAYSRIFGSKGGFQPSPGQQLYPGITFDGSFEPLPWPAARRFALSSQIAGLAANNSGVVIRNEDPLDSGSIVMIDAIDALAGVATFDLIMTMHAIGSNTPLSGPFSPVDVNSPPGQVVSTIANVRYAGFQGVPSATSGYRYFGLVGTPTHFVVNPSMARWTIGPQLELAIWCGTVNTQISFTIGGRYYASAS
jgi:hypothetical protein